MNLSISGTRKRGLRQHKCVLRTFNIVQGAEWSISGIGGGEGTVGIENKIGFGELQLRGRVNEREGKYTMNGNWWIGVLWDWGLTGAMSDGTLPLTPSGPRWLRAGVT